MNIEPPVDKLSADGVFLISARPFYVDDTRAIYVEECRHPGCSGKHLWRNRLVFDDLVMPSRTRLGHTARQAGHKHTRAVYRLNRLGRSTS